MTNNIIKFTTAGHVDDGKSTLIGRLLYDTGSLYDDQIEQIKKLSDKDIDYSLFVEGLESERKQKITIDVAYRYFSHNDTKFIIADAPGHDQYTKNMAVAAANSDIVVILIDAVDGVKTQTIRHSYIANSFGIKNFIILVNKMDLVDYSEFIFDKIKNDYLSKIEDIGINNSYFIPISAINGDNIVKKSSNMDWYKGKLFLNHLSSVNLELENVISKRFLVQNVIKHEDERYYQGKSIGKKISIGDEVKIYPANQNATIKDIIYASENNISISLNKNIDIDRGAIFSDSKIDSEITFDDKLTADLIWFSDKKLKIGGIQEILVKINHNLLQAKISKINHLISIDDLSKNHGDFIEQNQIANIDISFSEKTAFDLFENNHHAGSFLIIDKNSNETLACGLITN